LKVDDAMMPDAGCSDIVVGYGMICPG
jgi:hypothetical protein